MENEKQDKDKLFGEVLSLSLKTFCCLIMLLVLSASAFFFCLPSSAMRLTYDLGMYKYSLELSRRAANSKDDSGRIEALLNGIELSDMLLREGGGNRQKKLYASRAIEFTEKYALSSGFEASCRAMSQYYLDALIEENLVGLIGLVDFISFKDYVFCLNASARAVKGWSDQILFDNEDGVKLITVGQLAQRLIDGDTDADALAAIYKQIAVSSSGILYGESFTDLYNALKNTVSGYLAEAASAQTQIRAVYLVKAAYNLGCALKELCEANGETAEKTQLDTLFTVAGVDLYEYMTGLRT